jgi:hypothetical protein
MGAVFFSGKDFNEIENPIRIVLHQPVELLIIRGEI